MVALLVMLGVGSFCTFVFFQAIIPLLLDRPLFSWFRGQTRVDKLNQRIRVATEAAEADEAEHELHEILDDRIEQANKR